MAGVASEAGPGCGKTHPPSGLIDGEKVNDASAAKPLLHAHEHGTEISGQ